MKHNELELLARIYNTLLLINTKGEDTMIMGDCLKAFQNFIITKKQELEQENNNLEKEE